MSRLEDIPTLEVSLLDACSVAAIKGLPTLGGYPIEVWSQGVLLGDGHPRSAHPRSALTDVCPRGTGPRSARKGCLLETPPITCPVFITDGEEPGAVG